MAKAETVKSAPPQGHGWEPVGFEIWEPKDGDFLEGYYVKTQEIPSPASDKEHDTFLGHHIRVPGEKTYTVSGAFLNPLFEQIRRGTRVRVVFRGEKARPGGRRMKYFDVYQNPKDTIQLDS